MNANTISRVGDAQVSVLANPSGQTVFQLTSGGATLVTLPPDGRFDMRSFIVRATGRITTGASMTVNVGVQSGSSTTPASNSTLANPSATVNGSVPFSLELLLTVDSVSKSLNGVIRGHIGSTTIAQAAITPVANFDPAKIVSTSGSPVATGNPFVVTVTFGATNANNVAVLKELSIEQL